MIDVDFHGAEEPENPMFVGEAMKEPGDSTVKFKHAVEVEILSRMCGTQRIDEDVLNEILLPRTGEISKGAVIPLSSQSSRWFVLPAIINVSLCLVGQVVDQHNTITTRSWLILAVDVVIAGRGVREKSCAG